MLARGATLAWVLHPPTSPTHAGVQDGQLPVGFWRAWCLRRSMVQSPTKMLLVMGCGSPSISGCPAQMNTLGLAREGCG